MRFQNWAVYSKSVLQKCQHGDISLEEMKEVLSGSDWMYKDETIEKEGK